MVMGYRAIVLGELPKTATGTITLAPIVDARGSSAVVDCFIYVVEWGRTKIDVVKHALHTAPNVYENIVGTVLNKTDIKEMASYNGSRSDYYSESHYEHYGVSDSPSRRTP